MAEYIKREDAIQAAKHAWAKGLEPSQYIERIPTANVAEVRHGSASMAKRVKFPLTVTENPLFVNACT